VSAATLFRDTVARLVPCVGSGRWWEIDICPTQILDRSRAFERSLEFAWENQVHGVSARNAFRRSFAELWDPKGDAPALLLNTTEVETGDRVVMAPFKLGEQELPSLSSLVERSPNLDLPLSTAAGLSARFPGLSSAGWYYAETPEGKIKRRLVDGGYFDNSGIATALDVINVVRRGHPNLRFILIALTGDDNSGPTDGPGYAFGELLSPLRTLESIRRTRADLLLEQAHRTLDGGPCRNREREKGSKCASDGNSRQSILATGDQLLPLGWFLAEQSRVRISWSIGDPGGCGQEVGSVTSANERRALSLRSSNNCLLRNIGDDLSRSWR